uniref:Uncharacterized protein n=1 Tax=Arundo donax TaxID=35708 RepID=A0A0A9EMT3_ARUDO
MRGPSLSCSSRTSQATEKEREHQFHSRKINHGT